MASVLVVCIGNELVADDAVGWAVFQRLRARSIPPNTRLQFQAVSGMRVLDELDGEDLLIVVDAQCSGAPAGTVEVRDLADMEAANGGPVTSHDIGLREALQIGHLLHPERMPKAVVLVGIEGKNFQDIGAELTPEVARAVAVAADQVMAKIMAFSETRAV